jgi:hypothetical protein
MAHSQNIAKLTILCMLHVRGKRTLVPQAVNVTLNIYDDIRARGHTRTEDEITPELRQFTLFAYEERILHGS